MKRTVCWAVARCLLLALSATCGAQEQYPKPLIHTPTNHPAARVLLLSVDGLRAVDLANWIASHPRSALAELSARGVTYTNAHTPMADPAAGLMALTTGGTPISTGIVSNDGFDHALSPAGSSCKSKGAALDLNASFRTDGSFDPTNAPLDPKHGCAPLHPHELLQVNTIFEVVREKIGPTAWAGETAATTDLLRGPSGKGLDQACGDTSVAAAAGDEARVAILLHWIDGKDCKGTADSRVPALFGMSFASLATEQAATGYIDAAGTPSDGLAKRFEFVDGAIGRAIHELKIKQLYDSTWIFVASPYGQSPMDQRRRRIIPVARVRAIADAIEPGLVVHITGGDGAMIWLSDPSKTAAVVKIFGDQAAAIGIQDIYSGERLALTLNSPAKDSRMPDIVLQSELGVLWGVQGDTALEAYGGMLDEDTHVALLVSGAQLTGRNDPTYVPTTQLGPLLLRALGMEKFDLQALHLEHSPALPGIF
jgi:hypothetical protein